MNIQDEKLSLIKYLAGVNEPSVIRQFIALKNEQTKDWWDVISEEEKNEIDEGIKQADSGEVISHEKAMALFDKWRSR